jgi:hypothetical protein
MPSRSNDQLRQQIQSRIAQPVAPIEKAIAQALSNGGIYRGNLSMDELTNVMRKVLYRLIGEQRVGGMAVPIVHNVSQMEVKVARKEAHVFCEAHIHSPIIAFIQFRYVLANAANRPGQLILKGNTVEVKENTRPFDLAAVASLRVMNVKHIAQRELSDPNALIRRTLPGPLSEQGFSGPVSEVQLELTAENTMQVFIATSTNGTGPGSA